MVKTTVDTTSDRSVRSSTILQRTIHKTIAKKPKKPREKKQVARVSEEVASSSTPPPPESPTSSEMSAVPAEVLSALSTEQRTALEKYIKTVTTAPQKLVIPPIKVKQLNPNLQIPKYDPLKKTANSYLDDLESYFKHQGFEQDDFLDLLPSVLEEHRKSWFRHKKKSGYDWSKFRDDFKQQFDNASEQQRREHYLNTRRQRDDEPVESFIWEMFELGQQVNPLEPMRNSVQRCKQALVPRLRLAIGELSHTTPEALINRCKEVLRDLRAVDASEGRRTRLPPSTPNSNENKWRDRERHQGENYRKQYFNNNPPQYGNGNQSNGNRQDRDSNRGNRQDGDANREDNRNNQKMTKQEFRNETRPRYGRQPPRTGNRHADKECYRCKKKGHISRVCKATAFFFDEEDEKKEEGGAQGGGSDSSNLNDKGGH
ncbi:unnamed protein product [Orchesella dallaii]|uniref:CCHC-type domain-containing protein n=1 Tax=Orchesella dallaii TaxID=48710 RepID=A0ABP1PIC3_9HEXA